MNPLITHPKGCVNKEYNNSSFFKITYFFLVTGAIECHVTGRYQRTKICNENTTKKLKNKLKELRKKFKVYMTIDN